MGDRYTVERELGRGGMATVHLARDRKHDRPVAIKIMRPEIVGDQGGQRFLLEIQILARLQHPNILALLDSGTTGEASPRPFYVMPYVEGESLRQRLTREGPLPVTEALRLVREIGEALHYAHGQGLIHRDVKPENVLLSQGHALVADFGIARAAGVAAGQQLTQPGLGLGTPAYMSPEQTEGDRGVDARADQYSLACVLYELLAGQPPFTGPTMAAVLSRQLLDPVPPITTLRPGVPAPVRRAIERALSKVAADRFATVMEFLAAVEAPEAPDAPAAAAPKQAIVVLPFANLSPDPDNAYFADGLMEEVIADLSRVRALTVISRTSSIKLKETGWELRRIGRELNVRYALEGSVRRAGSTLRITAQLIDIETDVHLWAEKYSGTVDDVFDLQERLSRQIVEALRITLTPPEDREIAERPIADIRAYEYYQRARQEYYRYTAEGMAAARALAEHGLAVVGPNEALYGMLGTVYAWSETVQAGDEEATLREAEACARRAFELNPRSAQGLSIMGQVAYRRGQPGEAVRLLTQACAADPNNPDAMHQLGGAYLLGGRTGPMRRGADPAGRPGPADAHQSLPARAELLAGRRPHRGIARPPAGGGAGSAQHDLPCLLRGCADSGGPRGRGGKRVRVAGAPAVGRSPGEGGVAVPARPRGRPGGRAVAAGRGGARDGGVGRILVVPDGLGVRAGGRGGRGAEVAGACGQGAGVDRLRVLHAARSVSRRGCGGTGGFRS